MILTRPQYTISVPNTICHPPPQNTLHCKPTTHNAANGWVSPMSFMAMWNITRCRGCHVLRRNLQITVAVFLTRGSRAACKGFKRTEVRLCKTEKETTCVKGQDKTRAARKILRRGRGKGDSKTLHCRGRNSHQGHDRIHHTTKAQALSVGFDDKAKAWHYFQLCSFNYF